MYEEVRVDDTRKAYVASDRGIEGSRCHRDEYRQGREPGDRIVVHHRSEGVALEELVRIVIAKTAMITAQT